MYLSFFVYQIRKANPFTTSPTAFVCYGKIKREEAKALITHHKLVLMDKMLIEYQIIVFVSVS